MSTLHDCVYECPMCQTKVQVEEELIGENVHCPKCDNPFYVEPPSAEPLKCNPREEVSKENQLTSKDALDSEEEKLVVHPAMFRNHPLNYLLLMTGMGVGSGIAAYLLFYGHMFWGSLFAGIALVSLVAYLVWWIRVWCVTLTVTSKRSIYQTGFIAKKTSEVLHDDVRNIQVDQNVFERIFQIGDIAISSSGQDDMEIRINAIPNPDAVTKIIRANQ